MTLRESADRSAAVSPAQHTLRGSEPAAALLKNLRPLRDGQWRSDTLVVVQTEYAGYSIHQLRHHPKDGVQPAQHVLTFVLTLAEADEWVGKCIERNWLKPHTKLEAMSKREHTPLDREPPPVTVERIADNLLALEQQIERRLRSIESDVNILKRLNSRQGAIDREAADRSAGVSASHDVRASEPPAELMEKIDRLTRAVRLLAEHKDEQDERIALLEKRLNDTPAAEILGLPAEVVGDSAAGSNKDRSMSEESLNTRFEIIRRRLDAHERLLRDSLKLQRDLARVWKALQRNEEAIDELRAVVSPLPAKVEPVGARLAELRGEIADLRKRVGTISCECSSLASKVQRPGDELDDLKRDLEGLSRVVTRLSHDDCDQREEQRQAEARIDGRRIKTTRNERFRRSIVLGGRAERASEAARSEPRISDAQARPRRSGQRT